MLNPARWSNGFAGFLNQYAIVKNREPGQGLALAIRTEAGSAENDIEGLPFAWFAAGIDQRRVLSVNRSSAAVRVGGVLIAVQNLDFKCSHQEYTTISSPLPRPFYCFWGCEFDMQLAITETLFGNQKAAIGYRLHRSVLNLPPGLLAISVLPVGKILSVEEDDGVTGRAPGFHRWRDDNRSGSIQVVGFPTGWELSRYRL